MSIALDEPSPRATDALVREVRRLLIAEYRPRAFRTLQVEKLAIARPLRLYSSTLQAAAHGNVLRDAKPSGWQYFVLESGEVAALGEVSLDDRFSSLALSPAVRDFGRALSRLLATANAVKEELSLRIIRVPALSVLATWLHGQTLDWLVALPPSHRRLRRSQIYRGETFAKRLQEAAQKRIERTQQLAKRQPRL
jgi:hypothetical protein